MRIKTMLASLAAVGMLTLTACEDLFEDGSLQPDGSKPSLTVNNPTNNQSVTAGKGLHISITAVDKDEFKDIDFQIKGGSTENALVSFKKLANKNVLEFDTLLSLVSFAPGAYTLSITATDKRTNVTVQDVKFSVR